MKNLISFCALLMSGAPLYGQEVVSEPIGHHRVPCLTNSDTIVAVPFRKEGSLQTALTATPSVVGSTATLSVAATLTAGQLSKHFVKIIDGGSKDGSWFNITGNSENTITLDLNGDSLTGVASGAAILIVEYWTLDTLFPPASATTSWTETPTGSGNWVQNGHAVVASTSGFQSGRRSEIIIPNLMGVGVNLSSLSSFYLFNGGWRKQGQLATSNLGGEIIYPDQYFTIRHSQSVARNTIFQTFGEVEMRGFAIPLNSSTTGKQDNYIGLLRGVDLTLDQLTLGGTSAFVSSTSGFSSGRKDELLVFDTALAAQNRATSATYYYFDNAWRKQGLAATVNAGTDIIPSGVGFLVRKSQTSDGATSFWKNLPSY
jgi:uncharacterized protein (TIGR02597 family)